MWLISNVNGEREDSWAYFDTNSMKLVDANANLQRLHSEFSRQEWRSCSERECPTACFIMFIREWGKGKVLN